MTSLRQRFIEDLQLRNRSPRTVECYVFHLKKFACYFGQAPDRVAPSRFIVIFCIICTRKRGPGLSVPRFSHSITSLPT